MYNRFYDLRFIIGLFFTLVSLFLLAGYIWEPDQHKTINLYTGLVFILFGIIMMYGKIREKKRPL